MLTSSRLLPSPDVNISYHIMQQALEHEAACGESTNRWQRGSRKVEEGRKVRWWLAGQNRLLLPSSIMPALSSSWGAGLTDVWGKWWMVGEAASRLQRHDATDVFFLSVHAFWPHLLDRTWGRHLVLETSHKSTQGCHQHTGDNTENR